MFFPNLKNFSPYSGHIYNELKTGIVRKNGELISKNDNRFKLIERIGYFPFRELRKNNQAYFISDEELFDFFQTTEATLSDYHIDYYPGWNFEAKEQLLKIFLDGYRCGITDFKDNIGISYNTLSHDHKIEYLRNFCLYCLDFLYFDSELDKELFYNLGYIQANLYLGFVEINNLMALSSATTKTKNERISNISMETLTVKTDVKDQNSEPERIEIYCDVTEIKKIWRVLTEPITTSKGIQQRIFQKDELENYLGTMFSSGAFPDVFKTTTELPVKTVPRGDIRNVLIALMYCCYNLNRNFYRGTNQITYVAMLKRYFSAFATSELESIKSVLATYAPKGIEVLKNSIDQNPHVEEMLSILKIHKLLH